MPGLGSWLYYTAAEISYRHFFIPQQCVIYPAQRVVYSVQNAQARMVLNRSNQKGRIVTLANVGRSHLGNVRHRLADRQFFFIYILPFLLLQSVRIPPCMTAIDNKLVFFVFPSNRIKRERALRERSSNDKRVNETESGDPKRVGRQVGPPHPASKYDFAFQTPEYSRRESADDTGRVKGAVLILTPCSCSVTVRPLFKERFKCERPLY